MICYLNGKFLPYNDATIPVWDFGFTMGVTVTERLRTFGGKIYRLDEHLARLATGLQLTGIEPPCSITEIARTANEVAVKNYKTIDHESDLGIGICLTPGAMPSAMPAGTEITPTLLIYTLELPLATWGKLYDTGTSLRTVETREIPAACVPRKLKSRSRIHYYLADQEARKNSPGSHALLLQLDGNVAEATTASIVMVDGDTIVAPKECDVLPSVSLSTVADLTKRLGLSFQRRNIAIDELKRAAEVLWLSTSVCVLPVTRIDETKIGEAKPGPVFSKLIDAWSKDVGIEIVTQAQRLKN